ncbi:MAG: SDR family NAD(P)-dependent oxidoreductase [Spirochaetia bacterium]|jgi:NAD(P)-dependent dehydrogenase (short-subunit alcohol dehydrogenase family)
MVDPIVVLITGCSSGFGRAAAEVLARKGFRVYAGMRETAGRNADAASKLHDLNSESRFLRVVDLDVSSDASVEAAVHKTPQEAGKIDVLVNNAGLFMVGPMEAFTLEQWKMAFETNFLGAARMNRAVLPSMRRGGNGLLIHISSVAGRLASPADGVYCASKHALGVIAEVYRYELAPFGVDSVLIEPLSTRLRFSAKL